MTRAWVVVWASLALAFLLTYHMVTLGCIEDFCAR